MIADIATKNGGVDTIFTYHGGMKDYVTYVEFMACPLPVLIKVNNEQHSKTNLLGLK